MPPSPSLRCSPRRELRVEKHKRGLSLDGGLLFGEKDEDLALFNEMQTKEINNFLLQSTDDFEDTFSTKLRQFSDHKLGISVPSRGETSDLLNVDEEKGDYEWLLTPPDTPLFTSLDDETPPVNTSRQGRPRSQPISISRSSTMEKSRRSSRGSASPNRSSPSPRSGSSMLQSTGRAYSVPNSSPTLIQRQSTPSRRPSTPPSKPSTPVRRSSTPTPPRMSTGSGGTVASSGVRGVSPVKTSRGNSSSPKTRAWQTNVPGFSSDAPPNLRTSLVDRPSSYVRSSSPASRNGMNSTLKVGRRSMSPSASRSPSHSHDRDRFSHHSKGSVSSSGDDDMESQQPFSISSSDHSASKKICSYPDNKALAFSKKSAKVLLSPSSAPKRSLDSALRQMDPRKTPPNMFRPLLSSVSSTTFYAGKTSSAHRSLISKNSLVTTSSNDSSDQGTSLALDTEGSEHNQEDMGSDCEKEPYPDTSEEVFIHGKVDAIIDDVVHVIHDESQIQLVDFDKGPTTDHDLCNPEELAHQSIDIETSASPAAMHIKDDVSVIDNLENIEICSYCGCKYHDAGSRESDIKLCPDCSRKDKLLTVAFPDTTDLVAENSQMVTVNISEAFTEFDEFEQLMPVPEPLQVAEMDRIKVSQYEGSVKDGQGSSIEQIQNHSPDDSLARSLVEDGEQKHADQPEMSQPTVSYTLPDSDTGMQQSEHFNDYSSVNVDVSEGNGISVLLKRSSSIKWPVLQGRTFTATSISYDDPSYARDSTNSMRSSFGHGSVSSSSSVSSRRTETRVHRQLSSKFDKESFKNGKHTRSQSTGTSFSGVSNSTHLPSSLVTSTHEDVESSNGNIEHDVREKEPVASQELMSPLETTEADISGTSVTRIEVLVEDVPECNGSTRAVDASTTEFSCDLDDIGSGKEVATCPKDEEFDVHENGDSFQESSMDSMDLKVSVSAPGSASEEGCTMMGISVDGADVPEVPPHGSLNVISEIESEHCHQSTAGLLVENISSKAENNMDDSQGPSVPVPLDKDSASSVQESKSSDYTHDILEESTVRLEGRQGSHGKSLTLEEATDTILFCSSIVHDLAYQAAVIAIEKENTSPLEESRPTVTILGKSNPDRYSPQGRTIAKRTSKSNKARQRHLQTNTKSSPTKPEDSENMDESFTRNVGLPDKADHMKPLPPKLESKCNCTIM